MNIKSPDFTRYLKSELTTIMGTRISMNSFSRPRGRSFRLNDVVLTRSQIDRIDSLLSESFSTSNFSHFPANTLSIKPIYFILINE